MLTDHKATENSGTHTARHKATENSEGLIGEGDGGAGGLRGIS